MNTQSLFGESGRSGAAACLSLLLSAVPGAAHGQAAGVPPGGSQNLSLKLEVERAIDRGLDWLREQQDPESGAWGDTEYPALTALAVTAFMGDPSRQPGSPPAPHVEKGYEFILSKTKSDGGIYGKGLGTYNTALSLVALLQKDDPKIEEAALNARRFLINQQADYDVRGESDNLFDGGVGYGGTYSHSDLSNTHFALEALYYAKALMAERPEPPDSQLELDWDAAITFVERCQNLTSHNDQPWASDDPANKGGFVYFPGDSKAGEMETEDGRTALRSYGSMSYAGLLSLIYASLTPEDPRVEAVLEWLQKNYTLEENPGLDGQGLFYYYHTMAKALRILDIEQLELADGTKVDWRRNLALKLFDLQRPDGSWVNDTGRWWENDPILVTAYAVLTLEHVYNAL